MSIHEPILRAFGGGALKGDNFVRWVYLDEAGTSAKERLVTVAGVIIDADKHHRALKLRLNAIRDSLPVELQDGLIFHAKDIWHGAKQFDRARWESFGVGKDARRNLVEQICAIPAEFSLPVVYGMEDKEGHQGNWLRTERLGGVPKNMNANRFAYAAAFGACAVAAEAFIRDYCDAGEVGQIVAEDCTEMRRHAELAYSLLEKANASWLADYSAYIPVERLNEGPQFASKAKSPILQISDSIAFVLTRHYARGPMESDIGHCYAKFKDQISFPKKLGDFGL